MWEWKSIRWIEETTLLTSELHEGADKMAMIEKYIQKDV